MKKGFLILIVVVTVVLSATTSYFVVRSLSNIYTENVDLENSDNKFLSFASSYNNRVGDGYVDLTSAAESSVEAVVNIVSKQKVSTNQYYGGEGYNPFFELFGIPQGREMKPRERMSGGSGVILSKDGYIITNNHVVENASEVKVTLYNGDSFDAKIVGADPTTDIALLKIEAEGLKNISFGNSDNLKLGEWVLAVGSPYGLTSTVTAGIVSAKARNLEVIPNEFRIESFIQTDAAVNPGNSGGALVNTRGELVGINTVIKSPTGSYAGYSFAVPSSIVQKVVSDLREFGIVQRAMLGIGYNEITDEFIEKSGTGITQREGLYVGQVVENGAADVAGIRVGDVLLELNGVKTNSSSNLQEVIARLRPGDKILAKIRRNSEIKDFELVLKNRAGEAKLLDKNSVDTHSILGATFRDVQQSTLRKLGIRAGVQVVKLGEGLLAKSGIKEGYIITHINGVSVKNTSNILQMTQKPELIDGVYPNGRFISYYIVDK